MNRIRSYATMVLVSLALLGCNPDVTFFNQSFLGTIAGSTVPIAPGPEPGYVMVLGLNSTNQSVQFVVTAESEEIIVNLDGNGGVVSSEQARELEPETVNLLTDVDSPSLAIVFDSSPVAFRPAGPNELSFEELQDAVDQLAARDPESVLDRDFIRFVRILRIGLGPSLDLPPDQDEGIVVRPANSNPDVTAGSIFASGADKALAFDVGTNLADFGNGDIVIFLATTSANAVGGIRVVAGAVDGAAANGSRNFVRDTFEVLRDVEGPISPLPPD